MRRRRPCWSCDRPTPAAELVETHVRAGQTTRSGWWLSADRVVWLCPSCAAPLAQAHLAGKEVIPLFQALVVVGCVAAVLIVGIWTALSRPD